MSRSNTLEESVLKVFDYSEKWIGFIKVVFLKFWKVKKVLFIYTTVDKRTI